MITFPRGPLVRDRPPTDPRSLKLSSWGWWMALRKSDLPIDVVSDLRAALLAATRGTPWPAARDPEMMRANVLDVVVDGRRFVVVVENGEFRLKENK